jgi:aspartate/methionine/tyrosine aminotransferase
MIMQDIELNKNVLNLKESSTLAINHTVKQMRGKGEVVYHFGFGQSPFPVPDIVVNEVKKYSHCKDYLPTAGLMSLRDEISNYLDRKHSQKFNKENILIGPGSKELIFQLLYLLEGPVILLAPSWVSYRPQISLKKDNTKILKTKKENNYKVTASELDEFCSKIKEKQKILIINNPHNPTGHMYSENEINEISKICKKHGIILISDEIYSEINFSKEKFVSFSKYLPDQTIVTGGMSKIFSAGGYRLGFVAIPKALKSIVSPLCSMFSETFSSVSAPIQYGSIAAFRDSREIDRYIKNCRDIHKLTSSYLYKRFVSMGLECSTPQGAFYLMINFENYRIKLLENKVKHIEELVKVLLDKVNVALLPGTDFYMDEDSLTARVATVDYDGAVSLKKLYNGQCLDLRFIEENCSNLVDGCNSLERFLNSL